MTRDNIHLKPSIKLNERSVPKTRSLIRKVICFLWGSRVSSFRGKWREKQLSRKWFELKVPCDTVARAIIYSIKNNNSKALV